MRRLPPSRQAGPAESEMRRNGHPRALGPRRRVLLARLLAASLGSRLALGRPGIFVLGHDEAVEIAERWGCGVELSLVRLCGQLSVLFNRWLLTRVTSSIDLIGFPWCRQHFA
jgi:hypothetical protein